MKKPKTGGDGIKRFWLACWAVTLTLCGGVAQAKDLVLKFVGTPTANVLSDTSQAAIDEFVAGGLAFNQADALCFEAPLVDLATRQQVGVGIDCLEPSAVDLSDSANLLGTGLSGDLAFALEVAATTFFLLPGGNLVNQGLTTVQPFLPGVGDAMHLTGSIPSGCCPGVCRPEPESSSHGLARTYDYPAR